ncbi:hypothetical protein J1792_25140 [Streptomyces triculaminicus]|uniref:Uncharacterized protein n=2 Tax=Streptomyces TaxID=1883 RepID=A0A939JTP8_9ACTN|nr:MULTISPECIES: hypothetical protein [Streptomyces]MBO0655934.1 hypothetical protein [Streptomyces triculaminicus]QSY49933.1 hypothetical protein J3S04_02305 [Streptomyces griseocarneus]
MPGGWAPLECGRGGSTGLSRAGNRDTGRPQAWRVLRDIAAGMPGDNRLRAVVVD